MGQLLHQLLLVLVIMVSLEGWLPLGCLEEERIALLQLKHSFNYPNSTSLPSWTKDDVHCCNWESIECNATTGRVTAIYLLNRRDLQLGDWYLNVSLFLPFEELNDLSLAGTGIVGCAANEDFQKLWKFGNLKSLDLSANNFNNISILMSCLSGLSSLTSLCLSNNKLKGSINIHELNRLRNLEYLDLGGNEIEGFNSYLGGEELLKLNHLEFLDLSNNSFDNNILSSLKGLSSLKRLSMSYNRLKGLINLKELDALSNLEELDLSGNDINKFVGSRGLRKLNTLWLSNITTYGRSVQLLQSLGAFPDLTTLGLSDNDFKGTIFGEDPLRDLSTVEELHLDYSSLDENSLQGLGAVLPSLKTLYLRSLNGILPSQGLHELITLEELDLSSSSLDENSLQSLGALPSLKTLSLRSLNSSLPSQGLCELKHLQELDISYSDFRGILPPCLANFTSLQKLDISSTQVKIPISLSPFYNLSELKYLDGSSNEIYVEEDVQNLTPKFQLEYLDLGGCQGYGGKFPEFLYHQHNLQYVDLSNIKMKGEFPNWLLGNNTSLVQLSLSNSSLSGPFCLPVHSHMNLSDLDISNNNIQGHIPVEIGAHFPRLEYLSMSDNGFTGTIPSSLGNMSLLSSLKLFNNFLSGKIPDDNSLFSFSYLRLFDVSTNSLSGGIPRWMTNMSSLEFLWLSRNKFSGSLPSGFKSKVLRFVCLSRNRLQGPLKSSFYGCFDLKALDLSHNYLSGGFPEWIGELSQLRILLLSHNNFKGEIPIQFCKLQQLSLIDLSHNHLYGHILSCLRSRRLGSIDPYGDPYVEPLYKRGPIPVSLQQPLEFTTKKLALPYKGIILRYFTGIDLSCNNLTGEIPPEFGNLSEIKVLNLSHNILTGPIPQTFSNLKEIESLDLSYNKLNGTIPSQLTQLYSLEVFSVAQNNLSGKTPERVAQFGTFDESSYKENPFLCGPPLPKSCNAPSLPLPLPRSSSVEEEGSSFIDMYVFYVSFGVAYFMVLLGMATVLYINPYWRRAWFYWIERSITKSYYFLVDNLPILSKFGF